MAIRALCAILVAAAVSVAVPSRADAGCDDSDGQGYDYWDGEIILGPLVGYAADRFLVIENRDLIALDRTGAVIRERRTDLAANLNARRLASSPDTHLLIGVSQVTHGDLVADLLAPDGGDISRDLLIAEEPVALNFESPAVAWVDSGFDVAWIANDGGTTFWVWVSRVYANGEVATTARQIAMGRRSTGARTQPVILASDAAVWLVWDDELDEEQPNGWIEVHPRIIGVRLDPYGLPIDLAPVLIANDHRLLAAAARGGEVLVVAQNTVTSAFASVRIDGAGPIGAPALLAIPASVSSPRLAPRPDGYLLTWADGNGLIPRRGALTTVHLDPLGATPTMFIEDVGFAPAVATDDGGEMMIAFAHDILERRGEVTSRLEVTHVHPDDAADSPRVLREHDLTLENTGCGCSAADGGGLLPVLLALGLVALSRRWSPSGKRAARASPRSTR